MHSTVSIEIGAPAELVFRLTRDIERWPELLPHYVSVHRVGREPAGRLILRMIAVRPTLGLAGFGPPVVWRARTWAEPSELRLRFQHLGGVTAGMDVTWRIEATASGCEVAIDHAFRRRLPIPGLGKRVSEHLGGELLPAFVDRFFTRPIARRTLATFKALAEAVAADGTSDLAPGTYPRT